MIIDLLLICCICVAVIDLSGFVESVKSPIKKWLKIKGDIRIKPFDCSLCMSFWSQIIYLIYLDVITIKYIALSLLFALMTTVIKDLFYLTKDILTKIIILINDFLKL